MRATIVRAGAREWIVIGFCAAITAAVFLIVEPVPQPQSYHQFADRRPLLGISNGFDVLSNVPFAFVGLLALRFLRRTAPPQPVTERRAYTVLFLGVLLTSVGSAFYHVAPSDRRLVWDRLPMTIGFMGFFAAVIGERISDRWGQVALAPLLVIGAGSVAYWYLGESRGVGDLRPYLLVQFVPLAAILLMMVLYEPKYTHGGLIVVAIGLYGVAKICELYDRAISSLGVSGHTLKHLVSAAAVYTLFVMLKRRRPVSVRWDTQSQVQKV